jgi:hexulose-6-phosphate isomerase
MTRRNFLRGAVATAGAISVSQTLPVDAFSHETQTKQPAKTILQRSIMWGSVGIEGSIADKCKAIRAAGFDGVEPNSHIPRREMLEAARSAGLQISSVCNSRHWEFPMSHPDPDIRQKGIDAMRVALEDAAEYETDAVLLVPGIVNNETAYDQCWQRSVDCIGNLIPLAEKLKVKICIENVWNNFLLSPLEACRYIDQFDSQWVGFYFDCGNILAYGLPHQWINILGHRIGRIHIKEYSQKTADSKGRWAGFGAELGDGDVPWKDVMQAIRNNYNGGWLTTEQGSNTTLDEMTDLRKRLDNIMSL